MLILDLLLLVMIGLCIGYSWMLNKRIQDLQNSRIEFARMIKELNASIIKAESSVTELSDLSKVTSDQLKSSIDQAKTTCNELLMINDIGNNLADKLGEQIVSIKREQKNLQGRSKNSDIIVDEEEIDFPKQNKLVDDDITEEHKIRHSNHLKNFLANIITKRPEETTSLNQSSYYDTLRKISGKK